MDNFKWKWAPKPIFFPDQVWYAGGIMIQASNCSTEQEEKG